MNNPRKIMSPMDVITEEELAFIKTASSEEIHELMKELIKRHVEAFPSTVNRINDRDSFFKDFLSADRPPRSFYDELSDEDKEELKRTEEELDLIFSKCES